MTKVYNITKDICKAVIQWSGKTFVQTLGIVAGFVIIPIGLLFKKEDKSITEKFKYGHGYWYPVHLPKILEPWDNLEDGFRGDRQGRYWNRDSNIKSEFLKMINWGAFRNPFNNYKRYKLGIDIRHHVFTKLAGQDYVRDDLDNTGWQFLKGTNKSGESDAYMFYLVYRYGSSNRGLVIQLGNKIKLSHNTAVEEDEYDYWKGFTMEINPFKDIS